MGGAVDLFAGYDSGEASGRSTARSLTRSAGRIEPPIQSAAAEVDRQGRDAIRGMLPRRPSPAFISENDTPMTRSPAMQPAQGVQAIIPGSGRQGPGAGPARDKDIRVTENRKKPPPGTDNITPAASCRVYRMFGGGGNPDQLILVEVLSRIDKPIPAWP